MKNTPLKRELVEKLLRIILPSQVVVEYMECVYEQEECCNDPIQVILNNAYWWHSGGEVSSYMVQVRGMNVCVYSEGEEQGAVTIRIEENDRQGL